jgi:predicted acylesterase/phospholipase RssA
MTQHPAQTPRTLECGYNQAFCDRKHKYIMWVFSVLFVMLTGISGGATYALKVATGQEAEIIQLKVEVNNLKDTIEKSLNQINAKLDKQETKFDKLTEKISAHIEGTK